MPVHVDSDTPLMYTHSPIIFTRFPIPEPQFAISVPWAEELTVWTKFEPASIAWAHMACKVLFTIELKTTMLCIVDHHAIVHRLAGKILAIRVHCSSGYRMHVWLWNVFCYDRYAKLPHINLLVIGGWNKSLTILYKCQSINRAHVALVLLDDLLSVQVKLKNLAICAPCKENILLVIRGVKLYTQGSPLVRKTSYHLASLSVPELNDTIVTGWQKPSAIISEADISYCLLVAHVSSNALAVSLHIPYLTSTIMTSAQHQVACLRKKSHFLNALVVAGPSVKPLFRNKTIVLLLS